MNHSPYQSIGRLIRSYWENSGAWPDLIEIMQQALSTRQAISKDSIIQLSSWVQLPGLCCQAAGGRSEWADDITAAWLLFYSAAHIMDSVEDGDPPDPWWASRGPGMAINTATGLYFTASALINKLYLQDESRSVAPEIAAQFYNSFLSMCSGQHRDLTFPSRSLNQYWEIAQAKSGTFFSLACFSGARLATSDPARLEAFQALGCHLGLLIQILDDLEDFQQPVDECFPARVAGMLHALPVIYALEVSPEPRRGQLLAALNAASSSLEAGVQAVALVEASGAALYLATKLEQHRLLALEALSQTHATAPAGESLDQIIRALCSQPPFA